MGRNELKNTLYVIGLIITGIGAFLMGVKFLVGIICMAIGLAIAIIGTTIKSEEEMPEAIEAAFKAQGYSVTDKEDPLYMDSVNKKWAVLEGGIKNIFDYSDILSFELIEDGQRYEQKGGVTRAVVGGALFGAVGAVVGSQTAKGKSTISQMYICVYTKQSNHSLVKIDLINSQTSTDGGAYINAKNRALLLMSKFAIMQAASSEDEKQASANSGIADEIKKYKDLFDCGAITKEEFEEAKNRLFKSST